MLRDHAGGERPDTFLHETHLFLCNQLLVHNNTFCVNFLVLLFHYLLYNSVRIFWCFSRSSLKH